MRDFFVRESFFANMLLEKSTFVQKMRILNNDEIDYRATPVLYYTLYNAY